MFIVHPELLFHLIPYRRVTNWHICFFLDWSFKKKQSVLRFYLSRLPGWRWFSCTFHPILNRSVLLQPLHRAYNMEQCMDEKNCRDIKTKLKRNTYPNTTEYLPILTLLGCHPLTRGFLLWWWSIQRRCECWRRQRRKSRGPHNPSLSIGGAYEYL